MQFCLFLPTTTFIFLLVLLSDLLSILRGNIKYPFAIPFNKRKKIKSYNKNDYINSLYMRFEVKDKPGVLSQITNRLAKYKISVNIYADIESKINEKMQGNTFQSFLNDFMKSLNMEGFENKGTTILNIFICLIFIFLIYQMNK